MEINKNTYHYSIEQMTQKINNITLNDKKTIEKIKGENSNITNFAEILNEKREKISFSKHANERLESRNIKLSNEQLERLNKGVDMAKEKGIKDSLIMLDEYAFIVNIKNNTVITAMKRDEKNIFTNIDGTVIV